jgi:hypothetical protein
LELIDDKFDVLESNINNGINFHIITPCATGLPERVGMLFFNIDKRYSVTCAEEQCEDEEFSKIADKIFNISIKKR